MPEANGMDGRLKAGHDGAGEADVLAGFTSPRNSQHRLVFPPPLESAREAHPESELHLILNRNVKF
jgi:hypothetical protein